MKKKRVRGLIGVLVLVLGMGPFFASVEAREQAPAVQSKQQKPTTHEANNPLTKRLEQAKRTEKVRAFKPAEAKQAKPRGEAKADPPLELPEGYEAGTNADTVIREVNGQKLALKWLRKTFPMLTYNGSTYVYSSNSIDMNLLVNKSFSLGIGSTGGLFSKTESVPRTFGHNADSLYQAFYFDDDNKNHFKMEVIQTFNEDHSVNVTYTLHNLTDDSLQIGLLEYADLLVGSDSVPVTPVNGFRGFSLKYGSGPRLTILPKDFVNWSTAGRSSQNGVIDIKGFKPYTPHTADGVGWETGFQNGNPTKPLKENVPVDLGDTYLNMKSVGKNVAPNESISFEQVLKYGEDIAPDLTLDQDNFSTGKGEDATVKGQVWDPDTANFNVALADKATNTTVAEKDFSDIPLGEKQPFALTIPAEKLKLGKNEFIARVSDQWGEKKELPVTVTVSENLQFKHVPPHTRLPTSRNQPQ